MPDTITLYCGQPEVEHILSPHGLSVRLDDDQDGNLSTAEALALPFALGDAAETINAHCYDKYSPTFLARSNWINIRAAWLAAMALCQRRGNDCPESILDRCDTILEELVQVRDSAGVVPGCPRRMNGAPALSNVRADPRFEFKVLRVERNRSSKRSSPVPQVTDYDEAWTPEI
jgi:hypothetical protein